jgi:FkbM family methyltransferase
MTIYVQIGAGAGDRDPRANFRDGFTEFVKKKKIKDKIILVEANPLNIPKLKECWKKYSNTKIFNIAIIPDNIKKKKIKLFYSKDDKPHFQVTSISKKHVEKFYPPSSIKEVEIKTLKISRFLKKVAANSNIEYLALDVEGIDFEILFNLNLKNINIKNISIETLHINKLRKKKLARHLLKNGFVYKGKGFDVNGYDTLFSKSNNFFSQIKTRIKYRLLY